MDTEHDYSCDVGSMATEQQLAIVCRHVDDAVSKGAKVLTGGKPNDNGGLILRADGAGRRRPRNGLHA